MDTIPDRIPRFELGRRNVDDFNLDETAEMRYEKANGRFSDISDRCEPG